MTTTKVELQNSLSEAGLLEGLEAKVFVDTLCEGIRSILEKGHDLTIANFGAFEIRDKASRPGRNLRTGENVTVKARRVATFHASQKLRDAVAELSPSDVEK